MKGVILLLIFCVSGLVCDSQTHREDSILKVHKIDSLIEAKTKAYYNNKFFTLNDTAFEVGSVLIRDIIYGCTRNSLFANNITFIDSLKQFLAKNEVYIEVESHTYFRGSEQYNLKLTDRRALTLKNDIIEDSLISEERISYVGYGENQPIFPEDFVSSFYKTPVILEELHSVNRRTVFRITKVN